MATAFRDGHGLGATNDGASHRDAATTEQGASRRFYNFLGFVVSEFPVFLIKQLLNSQRCFDFAQHHKIEVHRFLWLDRFLIHFPQISRVTRIRSRLTERDAATPEQGASRRFYNFPGFLVSQLRNFLPSCFPD